MRSKPAVVTRRWAAPEPLGYRTYTFPVVPGGEPVTTRDHGYNTLLDHFRELSNATDDLIELFEPELDSLSQSQYEAWLLLHDLRQSQREDGVG